MWNCRNCGTENEENFKFCWSCGQTCEKSKPVEVREEIRTIPKQTEPKIKPVREVKKFEEAGKVDETKSDEISLKVDKADLPPGNSGKFLDNYISAAGEKFYDDPTVKRIGK